MNVQARRRGKGWTVLLLRGWFSGLGTGGSGGGGDKSGKHPGHLTTSVFLPFVIN